MHIVHEAVKCYTVCNKRAACTVNVWQHIKSMLLFSFVFIIYTGYAGIGRRGELQAVLDLLQQCLSRAGGMRVSFYNVFTLSILEMNKSNSTSDLNWQNVRIYSFHLPELCSLVPGIHNAYMERVGIYTMLGTLKTHFLDTIDLCSQWPPLNCAFILLL